MKCTSVHNVVQNRNSHAADQERCDLAGHQGDGESLKDWVGKDHGGADNNGESSQEHGAEADSAGVDDRLCKRHAFGEALFDEVNEDDRVANDDACASHEANHGGGGEKRAEQAMCGKDADERKWNRHHDDERREETAKPADHQNKDQDQHRGESGSEVAEDFDGDVPFAIPFDAMVPDR